MFNKIVVGTDGSEHGRRAVEAAVKIAAGNPEAELHVVMAYHPMTAQELAQTVAMLPDDYRNVLHAHYPAEDTLERARMTAQADGVTAHLHEVDEDPTDALVGLAENIDADLLVVGSRGEGLAKRVMHGSVSTKVLHHAPCSVLVVL
ncbi:MAG: universal stress protein [Acidimicrobiia bacterium]|nr:universal stress protein [Acidimicrobiia bacterium]